MIVETRAACGLFHQGNGEDTGSAAQSTADGLKQLVGSARGVAATVPAGSNISPNDVLDAVDDILDKSANLIAAAKSAVEDPDNPNSKAQLTQVYHSFLLYLFHAVYNLSSDKGQPHFFVSIFLYYQHLPDGNLYFFILYSKCPPLVPLTYWYAAVFVSLHLLFFCSPPVFSCMLVLVF